MKRKPNSYDRDQHELICDALGVSYDYRDPGNTAYEEVCVLLIKIEMALNARSLNEAKNILKSHSDSFDVIPMYGVE